ncbi:MAG: D-sedoheptulose 7-phosphate isomerase [Alphaproteobacteria bacterium]|nr:D-sedoheptulose 7-phosphate isomerase [Alphaproteobacteria bacterium]
MDIKAFFEAEMAEHRAVADRTAATLGPAFERLVAASVRSLQGGGKLLFFGNGGSAADAQHLATEFTVRYKRDRRAIPAIALTTDSSTLTAIGNDLGFDQLFARQIEALGRPGDVAIGITTSGRSRNVLLALREAERLKIVPAALCGRGGGDLVGVAEPLLIVPSETTARIQEMHITLGQMLCGAVEIALDLA